MGTFKINFKIQNVNSGRAILDDFCINYRVLEEWEKSALEVIQHVRKRKNV